MLITIVTETFAPDINGVSMTLGRLVAGLVEKSHNIQLVCTDTNDRCATTIPEGVEYHPVKGVPVPGYSEARFGLPSKKNLKALWSEKRPDVIYVATEGPLGLSAVNISKKLQIPVISGFHTNFQAYSKYYGFGFISKIVERYLVSLHNKTSLTLTPTISQKYRLHDMGIKDVSVLSRGVDTQLFSVDRKSQSLRLSWGAVNEHDPVLLYVGRIAAEKNLDLAIETYYMMLKVNSNLKFVLVGDGPLLNKIQEKNPDFIFAGMKKGEELAKYYASSDIFIFPSLTETFGNVVLEAMASGLGVIAYDYAAANMHIRHGVNGMIAKVKNKYEFVSNACDYLDNVEFLNEIKEKARQYALNQSWLNVIEQFEGVLHKQAFNSFNQYPASKETIRSHA